LKKSYGKKEGEHINNLKSTTQDDDSTTG